MSQEHDRLKRTFGLSSLLLAISACGLWLGMFALLWDSRLVSPGLVAMVLCGITGAIGYLFRGRRNAWLIGAVAAPLIAFAGLLLGAVLENTR
jgi:hypothetical protein